MSTESKIVLYSVLSLLLILGLAPPTLTKPQLEGLRLLGDGQPHEGAPATAHGWIGGAVAKALITHGYAVRTLGSSPTTYVITDAGKARLAQEAPCNTR